MHVSVVNDTIVITMAGTSYSVTYYKRDDPWLLTSDTARDELRARLTNGKSQQQARLPQYPPDCSVGTFVVHPS